MRRNYVGLMSVLETYRLTQNIHYAHKYLLGDYSNYEFSKMKKIVEIEKSETQMPIIEIGEIEMLKFYNSL